jgi:hypothetical protein
MGVATTFPGMILSSSSILNFAISIVLALVFRIENMENARMRCIELKGGLNVNVIVPDEIKSQLTLPQKDELMKEFNIEL